MWGNAVPDRAEQQELKRKAIIRAAAKVFSRRGSHGAKLDDVARQLGVSAAALYRYVSNKNDLILACHEEAMEIAERALNEGAAVGRNGLEKVRLSLRNYLVVMMAELGVPALILEENVLEGPAAERIYALRDDYERRLRGLIEEGRRDGSILDLEPKVAVFTLLGAVHWTAKWYRETGTWNPEDVSDAIIEIATRGLAADPDRHLSATLHAARRMDAGPTSI
ncbi:MAG: TetR/AcrR family transcriptional regulator [Alphaproteobacteria bacterium]|nr:TetR/AcrR family transcriptional regulator [Alphaproteobacteria bacterium]